LALWAQKYDAAAIETLVDVCNHGDSDSACVSAAKALLDRGYGPPPQGIQLSGPEGGPIYSRVERVIIDSKEDLK
jgi:hypothetical protein